MYYINVKRLILVFLIMVHFTLAFSQERRQITDTLLVQKDSVVVDTLLRNRISSDAIDQTITHKCKGYRRTDFINKKVYLIDEAVVTYGDITLKADSIVLDMDTGVVYAAGRPDSTGKIAGLPVFSQGEEEFEASELTYNFKTRKGRVIKMMTEQEDGYLRSAVTKRLNDGSLNISASTYSTCDHDPPHFYVGFKKARVIPNKKIITGPAYLVLEDIPLPLVIPFGYFPIPKKKTAQSGILVPSVGQSAELGYSLREGGYYFAINDNFDLTLKGDLYTNGSWMTSATSRYIKRYKYSGQFGFSFANNITGHKGLSDYSKSNNYRIDWTYTQDPKARPNSRFSASVSMSSSGFDRRNSYDPAQHVNSQRQSSISYSKTWDGTPFNFSTSLNHSQNMRTKNVSLNLPKANFSMSRIYPLKGKNRTGDTKWYQELQFQYSASIDNQISTKDSLLFTSQVFRNMRSGFKHDAPLSIQIRPFKKLPGFTISPQLSYSGVLYTRKYNERWDPDYFNPVLNKTVPSAVRDTLTGFFYGQSVTASVGTGISPQIFGTYEMKNPNSRLRVIRHVMKPSVGFSYVPVIKGLTSDMYREVQIDTAGRTKRYSIFDGNIYGTPSLGSRSGNITFSLINIVEAKVFAKNDTTGKPNKVKIIDNFTTSTSYNIFADSIRWAPVTMNYRATLFKNVGFAASSSFSLYGTDQKGRTVNTFYLDQKGRLMRLTGLSLSLDFDLSQFFKSNDAKKKDSNETQNKLPLEQLSNNRNNYGEDEVTPPSPQSTTTYDRFGYPDFSMPWSLRAAYSFYYQKPGSTAQITQSLQISGDVTLTKKTSIRYSTGYDIARKQITMSSISITRDLHCWDMGFEWIPTGYMKSWFFTLRVKASVLQDLKYERRKDFHDQY